MMFRGKIAAVSYLNTIPFIYGIEHTTELCATLLLHPPSRCAELFKRSEVDIALVPVGALPDLENYKIVTSFCIGASTNVRSVTIMCNSPISQIKTLWLDNHSRSSALLAKILCEEHWGVDPIYRDLEDYARIENPKEDEAFLLIGDKVFDYEGRFKHSYDLAKEWSTMTHLPIVFAVWVAKREVSDQTIERLQSALNLGVENIQNAINYYGHSGKEYAYEYLTENIDFVFDHKKQSALELFWKKGLKFKPKTNPG